MIGKNGPAVTRRDFLGGVALVIGSGLSPLSQVRAEGAVPYPPALTGLRGSHPGSFETAHALRDGQTFDMSALQTAEAYDLIIVGAGISGLSAAWFWRQKHGPQARILILDNHDDFGGHARRNEFTTPDGGLLIGYGGSEALEAPKANFSKVVWDLMQDLGIDLTRFDTAFDQGLYERLGLSQGTFFDARHFGQDKLLVGDPTERGADTVQGKGDLDAYVADFPMSDAARAELLKLFKAATDPLAGRSPDEKLEHLQRVSYRDYLAKDWGLGEEALSYFTGLTHDYFAIGPDAVPASWAMESGYPGFASLGLDGDAGEEEPYIYHFPDGNASLGRLLVRALIPGVIEGADMEDVVTARADYGRLDLPDNPTRLRLNATVIRAENRGSDVEISYVKDGTVHRTAAGAAILACYNMVIPHIAPELPVAQKEALARNVKAPLVYVNVCLRDWQPMVQAGVSSVYCPTSFFSVVMLDMPVAMRTYRNPSDPAQSIILRMVHVPTAPGLPQNDQFRAGRAALLEMPFEAYETEIRTQLAAMFARHGFDADRDIMAITVNRWPHGYAGVLNPLFDKVEDESLMALARQPFGRIAIANSDAGWNAFAHEAIDQAHRAVSELS